MSNVISKGMRYFALTVVMLYFTTAHASTQSPVAIASANLSGPPSGNQQLTVTFDISLTPDDEAAAALASNYFVMDVKTQRIIKVINAQVLRVPGLAPATVILDLEARSNVDLDDPQASYFVFAVNLTFEKRPPRGLLQAKLQKDRVGATTPRAPPTTTFKESKSRQDSNIYVAGEITGASGTGPFTSLDVKVDIPLAPKNIAGKVHTFSPFFDLRASTNPKADPDSMNFGMRWSFPVLSRNVDTSQSTTGAVSGKFYSDLFWENSGKLEAERDFDNVNAIWDSRLVAPLNFINTRKTKLFLDLYAGSELGGNLKSPVTEADGKGVSRLLAGGALSIVFPFQRGDLNVLTMEGVYTRRWLLLNEVGFTSDNKGTLRPVFFGTKPREFVESKLNFQLNKFFGAYAGYEYGEVPPSYKLVDHRFRFGLVYKLKIERR